MPICESCLDSVSEEFGSNDIVAITMLIQSMGEDLPDHLCDKVESNGNIECGCPGHRAMSFV